MNRLSVRGLVASLALIAVLVVTGCDPGAGGGADSAAPAAPASAAPASAAPASAAPTDYSY